MNKYSKLASFITLAALSANAISIPVIAVDAIQKKPSNTEEQITDEKSEIELADAQSSVAETQPTVDSTVIKESNTATESKASESSKESKPTIKETTKKTEGSVAKETEATEEVTKELQTKATITPFGLEELKEARPNDEKIKKISSLMASPVGSQGEYSEDGKTLLINKRIKSQLGAIWSKRKISLKQNFKFTSYIYMGNDGKTSGFGDGMTFTLQNDDRGTEAIGSAGAGIGAYSTGDSSEYVANAISIEFDTYHNSGTNDPIDKDITLAKYGHVAFVTPSANNSQKGQHSGVYKTNKVGTRLAIDKWKTVIVDWDATSKQLTYNYDGHSNSYIIQDPDKQFGGTSVYWGFTASTGGSIQNNAVAITDVPMSVSHKAKLKNITKNETEYKESIEATPGNNIAINDHIVLDESSPYFTEEAIMTMDMKGIEYTPDTLTVDGKKVPEEKIIYADDQLSFEIGGLIEAGAVETDINLEAKVPESTAIGTKLSYSLNYDDAGILSDSNNINIDVVKVPDNTINIHYKEIGTDKELAPSETLKQEIGLEYVAKPKEIEGYLLDSDSGNATGIMEEDTKDVTFYYHIAEVTLESAPSELAFGEHEITREAINLKPNFDHDLIVTDTRADGARATWALALNVVTPIVNKAGDFDLTPGLTYTNSSKNQQTLSAATVIVEQTSHKDAGEMNLSGNWKKDEGFNLNVPSSKQKLDEFEGTLGWTLQKSVVNKEDD